MPREIDTGDRIDQIDVLRGFALCGILVVNIYQQVLFVGQGLPNRFPPFVEAVFYERFVTLFAVLFGLGFGIFLLRARQRTAHPRVILARRLAVLLVIGAVHYVFHPGEVLTAYAVAGLVVLIPVSFVSGRIALVIALVLLFVGPQIVSGYGLIPGLLVLGYALAELGLPSALATHRRGFILAAVSLGSISAVWVAVGFATDPPPYFNVIGGLGGGTNLLPAIAAICGGLAYACAMIAVLHTSAAHVLTPILAPLGRMALTNYVLATALFLVGAPLMSIDSADDAPRIAALTIAILVVQILWSRWWLGRFRYGPLEWAWRCSTWWTFVRNRRTPE
ncbi:DUF418 domain-containing protein [Rhodococcoides fascians]|uniref:DUF418 domain-containing protein n=1 Tax=Rhodococcoides fascians TaxID=1828 RepID=UPI00050C664B|nr:DUF418 domain-containing protein [Rhodococcus fascians]